MCERQTHITVKSRSAHQLMPIINQLIRSELPWFWRPWMQAFLTHCILNYFLRSLTRHLSLSSNLSDTWKILQEISLVTFMTPFHNSLEYPQYRHTYSLYIILILFLILNSLVRFKRSNKFHQRVTMMSKVKPPGTVKLLNTNISVSKVISLDENQILYH